MAVIPRWTVDVRCGRGKTGALTWATSEDQKFGVFCFDASGAASDRLLLVCLLIFHSLNLLFLPSRRFRGKFGPTNSASKRHIFFHADLKASRASARLLRRAPASSITHSPRRSPDPSLHSGSNLHRFPIDLHLWNGFLHPPSHICAPAHRLHGRCRQLGLFCFWSTQSACFL